MSKRKVEHISRRKKTKEQVKKKTNRQTSPGVTIAIAKMRKEGISLRKAARGAKVSPRTVIKKAASALRKNKSGRYTAKTSDRLVRVLMIPTPEGPSGNWRSRTAGGKVCWGDIEISRWITITRIRR